MTRFYTRRGGDAASTTQRLRSKYDAAVVTELLEFMDHKVASLREPPQQSATSSVSVGRSAVGGL